MCVAADSEQRQGDWEEGEGEVERARGCEGEKGIEWVRSPLNGLTRSSYTSDDRSHEQTPPTLPLFPFSLLFLTPHTHREPL